jgi:hypothetical protein
MQLTKPSWYTGTPEDWNGMSIDGSEAKRLFGLTQIELHRTIQLMAAASVSPKRNHGRDNRTDSLVPPPLIVYQEMFCDFQSQCTERQNRAARQRSAFVSLRRVRFSLLNGAQATRGESYKAMNARPEIRDALLVQRMNHWLLRARCPMINPRIPTWKARKNYWFLVRRYPALAASKGFTPTSVFK